MQQFPKNFNLKLHFEFQLKEVNRHPWVIAGGKGEMDLEDPMMEVVQTHIIPSEETIDADVVQVLICYDHL